jgi:hypothetical protein
MILIEEIRQNNPGLYYSIVSGTGGGDQYAISTEGGSPLLAEDGTTLRTE